MELPMFTTIVVAVDGSSHADRALAIAAELATRDDARLGIIYVVNSNISALPEGLFELSKSEHIIDPSSKLFTNLETNYADTLKAVNQASVESQRILSQLAEHITEHAMREAKIAGVKNIQSSIANGNPADEILAFAKSLDADAIVSGRRGMGSVKGLLMGSTSLKIAQAADCTCITVK